jgi:hypothetical protein
MNETFDDLFEDFFKKKTENQPDIRDEIKKIMDTISKFRKLGSEEELDDAIDNELGEPNEVEEYIENGFLFKKLTWNTPHGSYIKLVVTDIVDNNGEYEPENIVTKTKSLQEQLEEAVEAENYPLAIKLRDEIKKNGGDKV